MDDYSYREYVNSGEDYCFCDGRFAVERCTSLAHLFVDLVLARSLPSSTSTQIHAATFRRLIQVEPLDVPMPYFELTLCHRAGSMPPTVHGFGPYVVLLR